MQGVRFFQTYDLKHSEPVKIGKRCRQSFDQSGDWESFSTLPHLGGTCAAGIDEDEGYTEEMMVAYVKKTYGTNGHIAIIEGDYIADGNDLYEVVLANARIIKIIQ